MSEDITLYVVPNCPLCEAVRVVLNEQLIPFVERDVTADYSALRTMFKLTKQKFVPVVEKNGKAIVRPEPNALVQFCCTV